MKNITLTFAPRLKVTNILGGVTGSLDKMVALSAVYNLIRFTDDESPQITVTDAGNGMQHFAPPSDSWGTLETQIEDSHAVALLVELNAHQGFQVSDVGWVTDLRTQLSKEK